MDIQKIDELFKKANEVKSTDPKQYLEYCREMKKEIFKGGNKYEFEKLA